VFWGVWQARHRSYRTRISRCSRLGSLRDRSRHPKALRSHLGFSVETETNPCSSHATRIHQRRHGRILMGNFGRFPSFLRITFTLPKDPRNRSVTVEPTRPRSFAVERKVTDMCDCQTSFRPRSGRRGQAPAQQLNFLPFPLQLQQTHSSPPTGIEERTLAIGFHPVSLIYLISPVYIFACAPTTPHAPGHDSLS